MDEENTVEIKLKVTEDVELELKVKEVTEEVMEAEKVTEVVEEVTEAEEVTEVAEKVMEAEKVTEVVEKVMEAEEVTEVVEEVEEVKETKEVTKVVEKVTEAEEVTEIVEEVKELTELEKIIQIQETREQLRERLKNKIHGKKKSRTVGLTRKRGNNINDSLKKISDVIAQNKIESPEQINEALIQNIMSAISKDDLEIVLKNMQQNSQFKEMLTTINNKM